MKNLHDQLHGWGFEQRLLLALTILLFSFSTARGQTTAINVPDSLRQALEDAVASVGSNADCEQHLALVERIDRCLVGQDPTNNQLWLKTRFVEAVANLRLNNLDQSARQIAELLEKVPRDELPELWFRCRSVEAALQLLRGDRISCVKSLETLLSENTEGVHHEFVNKAVINYAAALNECGRTGEAADRYEEVMLNAIEQGHDLAAMQSGNNLISILVDLRDYKAAQNALTELAGVAARNPGKIAARVLRLRELDLQRLRGRVESATTGLRTFLADEENKPAVLNGVAHRILADSLRQKNQLDEAIKHARLSMKLLQNRANEATRSRITLAQILMAKRDYDRVLKVLSDAGNGTEWVPSRRKVVERLRLEASLRLAGRDDEVDSLLSMVDAGEAHEQQVSRSRSDYYSAKLEAARVKMEAQEADALARIAVKEAAAERSKRNILVGSISSLAALSCLMIFLYSRRRAERILLAEQQALTVELEEIVKTKTNELRENLSARARLAKALERKKRMEAIGLVAGNVAHDINNLLQVIASTNETLASGVTSQVKNQLLDVSNESLKNASAVIRNLLAFSRQQELSSVPIRISEYWERTTGLLRAAVGDHAEFEVRNDVGSDVNILADSAQLTTSLLNILGNAVDAMPDGGRIEFVASVVRVTVVTPDDSTAPGEYVEFRVTDSGCGMTEEQLASAFEPFYSTKTSDSGTGLGLSSAFGFAKQSRGDIRIESTLGVGTSVAMLLPIVNVPTHETPRFVISGQMPDVRRVLLVEDHNGVATSLQTLLQHLGFETIHVASGEEAQTRLDRGEEFGFILSDVCMPGAIDGPALADWVHEQKPDTPIFLMSGYSELSEDKRDLPLLQKPFNASQLSRFLQENLEPMSA